MQLSKELIKDFKAEYGEAFYLLDSKQFRNNFLELKQEFSKIYSNFNIAYSYKTNYIPKLCKIVNELGGYAEVVSEMEMELAVKCGVQFNRIIWNGPIKNARKLKEFVLKGGTVNLDNIEETLLVKQIAAENLDKVLNIGIRVNYDVSDGVVSRFGFDVESKDFADTMTILQGLANIHIVNFQCHFAKRQIDFWPARAKGMVELIDKVGITPERIDIGGGLFGKMAPELEKQFSFKIPEYSDYAKATATVFAEYFEKRDIQPELIIEPGSALVGDCMKFVGTIKTIKNVRGKYFASVLASQKNISMTGINPPVEVIAMGEDAKEYENLDMVGFTCIEGDVLYKNYCGKIAIGDVIVISNCGSYSLVMKPPFILPNFPVLDISEGDIEIIKRKETFEDIFQTFNF